MIVAQSSSWLIARSFLMSSIPFESTVVGLYCELATKCVTLKILIAVLITRHSFSTVV